MTSMPRAYWSCRECNTVFLVRMAAAKHIVEDGHKEVVLGVRE